MGYTELMRNIDSGKLNNMYLLHGRENYLIEEVQKKMRDTLNEFTMDFNISVLDGETSDYEGVVSAIETLPFMDERRIVIIKNFELLQGKRKIFTEKDEKNLLENLKNIPSTTVVVFSVDGDADKRKKLYKQIEKDGEVYKFDKLKDTDLSKWCRVAMKEKSINIMDSEMLYFLNASGYNDKDSDITLSNIKNEIDKLSAYAGDEPVDKKIINELLHKKSEGDVFDMVSAIAQRDSKRAVRVYRDMIEEGHSVLGIISLLVRRFSNILQIKSMREEKLPNKIIIENTGISQYVFNQVSKQSQNFSTKNIVRILEYLSEVDYKIKNGLIDDEMSIEILIAGLTRS